MLDAREIVRPLACARLRDANELAARMHDALPGRRRWHTVLQIVFAAASVCVASGAVGIATNTSAPDRVYTVHRINGSTVPYVTRLATTNGSPHTVELDELTLRLKRNDRFDVRVRYRHAAWERVIPPGAPMLDADFHGRYSLTASGALTLYPDPGKPGARRGPWNGTVSGDRVVFRRAIAMGTQSYSFHFELQYDRSIY